MILFKYFCSLVFFININQCNGNMETFIDDCDSLLNSFALSVADFVSCGIRYSRPICMCTSCVGAFNSVKDDHSKIIEIGDNGNATCKKKLINLDRLEIVEAGYTYATGLWHKGHCSNCFEADGIHLSNTTIQFQKLYQDTRECLDDNFLPDNNTYNPNVCQNCSAVYMKMNGFYDSLKQTSEDGLLCMDIVDSMNVTQNLWSLTLQCGEERVYPEVGLIISSCLVLFLPFVFYLSTWMLSKSTPEPVSRQKRLSTRFIERLRSRTGSMISQFKQSTN